MLPTPNSYLDGMFYDADGRPLGYLADGLRAFVTLADDGAVVAAVPLHRIRVYGFILSALGATAVHFRSAATPISLTMSLAATSGFVVAQSNMGWFETAVGEALNLEMSSATTVGVQVIYALVKTAV